MKTHIKQLFKRPSFYIGGTVGLLLFFFALGLGLNGPDATISLIGRRFVEISAFPPKLLLGPISHSFANLMSIVWVFFLYGTLTACVVRAIRRMKK